MSGIEVVAAVSAIISAFHGGSELLKHIKEKRRKVRQARQSQQEFEEKQLEDSLVSGKQQIGFRWEQDLRQFGDLIRVGDGKLHLCQKSVASLSEVRCSELMIVCLYSHSARPAPTHHDSDAGRGHQELTNGRSVRQCCCEPDYAVRSFHHEQESHFRYVGPAEAKTASQDAYQPSTARWFQSFVKPPFLYFVRNDRNEHVRSDSLRTGQLCPPGSDTHPPTRRAGFGSRSCKVHPRVEAQQQHGEGIGTSTIETIPGVRRHQFQSSVSASFEHKRDGQPCYHNAGD
jgi:hypothetical protein